MKRYWIILPFLVCAAHAQQQKHTRELSFSFNGAAIAISTESSSAGSPLSTTGSVMVGKSEYGHRLVVDKAGVPLFGYDIGLQKAGPGMVALRIKPVDQAQVRNEGWFAKDKLKGDLPTIAAPREFPPLRAGDAVQVDILYNPATNEKIWDVLRVLDGPRHETAHVNTPAGNALSFERVAVSIDGKAIGSERNSWMIGSVIAMSVRGHGTYYLLLTPDPNYPFQASGWVDHNVLRFRAGNESIEVKSKSNILQKSEYGTVWVYHTADGARVSHDSGDPLDFTAADTLDNILPKKHAKEE